MKKLILPIVLFLFILVFPYNVDAVSAKVCQDQYDSAMRSCLSTCKSSPDRERCEKSCYTIQGNVKNNCLGLPVNTSPTPNPSPKSNQSMPTDCWGKYMQVTGCLPKLAECNAKCPVKEYDAACMNACAKEKDTCDANAKASYDACVKTGNIDQKKAETKQSTPSDTQSTKPQQPKSGSIPVFIGGWFKTVSGAIWLHDWVVDIEAILFTGQDTAELANTEKALQYIDSITDEYAQFATGQTKDQLEELLDREPDVTDEVVNQLKQKTHDSPYTLDILKGQAQIKYPGQNRWVDLKEGDKIPTGSTIFTGMDTTTLLNIRDKGVVEVLSFTELTISENGLEEGAKENKTSTDIQLKTGEIEINVDQYLPSNGPSGPQGWGMSIYGPYYSGAIRGTHFWVKQEKGKQFASIGVYKGTVEVTTNGSKTPTSITPNGNKPGMIVVTQKPSTTKLAIIGLVLAAVLIGIVFVIKKKFFSKGLNQSKKK